MRSLHRLAAGLSGTEPLCHRALCLAEGGGVTSLDGAILPKPICRFPWGNTRRSDYFLFSIL